MNLRDLRKKALDEYRYNHVQRREMWELLNKLNKIVQDKFNKDYWACEYFEKFGCEIKRGDMPFKGDIDHIPLTAHVVDFGKARSHQYHINMPVEIAEKILVLGLP
jgi:hypothetical protein